jgi:hypothetical protein
MKKWVSILLAAAVLGSSPALAQVQLFDFNGQALLPAGVGGNLTMYSIVVNGDQVDTPIPLDFDNYQYTLVVTDLELVADGMTQNYAGGVIVLYEDNATAADYASPGTFVDGTAILSGVVTTLDRTLFIPTLGTVNGFVNWTGGTRLAEIPAAFRNDWAFLSGISTSSTVTEPGYDENWDGKVEPQEPIANQNRSWGEVKSGY